MKRIIFRSLFSALCCALMLTSCAPAMTPETNGYVSTEPMSETSSVTTVKTGLPATPVSETDPPKSQEPSAEPPETVIKETTEPDNEGVYVLPDMPTVKEIEDMMEYLKTHSIHTEKACVEPSKVLSPLIVNYSLYDDSEFKSRFGFERNDGLEYIHSFIELTYLSTADFYGYVLEGISELVSEADYFPDFCGSLVKDISLNRYFISALLKAEISKASRDSLCDAVASKYPASSGKPLEGSPLYYHKLENDLTLVVNKNNNSFHLFNIIDEFGDFFKAFDEVLFYTSSSRHFDGILTCDLSADYPALSSALPDMKTLFLWEGYSDSYNDSDYSMPYFDAEIISIDYPVIKIKYDTVINYIKEAYPPGGGDFHDGIAFSSRGEYSFDMKTSKFSEIISGTPSHGFNPNSLKNVKTRELTEDFIEYFDSQKSLNSLHIIFLDSIASPLIYNYSLKSEDDFIKEFGFGKDTALSFIIRFLSYEGSKDFCGNIYRNIFPLISKTEYFSDLCLALVSSLPADNSFVRNLSEEELSDDLKDDIKEAIAAKYPASSGVSLEGSQLYYYELNAEEKLVVNKKNNTFVVISQYIKYDRPIKGIGEKLLYTINSRRHSRIYLCDLSGSSPATISLIPDTKTYFDWAGKADIYTSDSDYFVSCNIIHIEKVDGDVITLDYEVVYNLLPSDYPEDADGSFDATIFAISGYYTFNMATNEIVKIK